jgi:predicted HTH transcriptional regulator
MRELFTWEQAQSLIDTAVEVADLDFKESAKDMTDIEAAKDIAALANTLGGHIVVGATTTDGRTRCNGLRGIEVVDADKAQRRFEAGAQRIRPAVQIATRQIRVPETSRALVIAQVSAAHAAPVGLQLQEIPGQELVGKGWVFPYRVGSQTSFFSPDQFSAFNAMPSRRAAALLTSIPLEDREDLVIRCDSTALHPEPQPVKGPHYTISSHTKSLLLATLK